MKRFMNIFLAAALWAALAPAACKSAPEEPSRTTPPPLVGETKHAPTPTRLPDARRIVAFGDIHGDLDAARRALRLGGLVDEGWHWSGGETVAVQVGDILDRGTSECEIIDLFERLTVEAGRAGGAFHHLLGNHEFINVAGDFRYMKPGSFTSFRQRGDAAPAPLRVASFPPVQRGRASAMLPGGWVARAFEKRNVVQLVGKNVFVHAGLLPWHADYGVDNINTEARAWVSGEVKEMPEILARRDAPTWTRAYSWNEDPGEEACAMLSEVLDKVGATRMIVGHTVQEQGINPACDGRIWRTDVGMCAHYGGPVQVLEIVDGDPRVLKETADAR